MHLPHILIIWTLVIALNSKIISSNNPIDVSHVLYGECPVCTPTHADHYELTAIHSYWHQNTYNAYACACQALRNQKYKRKSLLRALIWSLISGPSPLIRVHPNSTDLYTIKPQTLPLIIKTWDVIGPLPVGKLEVDGDPVFVNMTSSSDIGSQFCSSEESAMYGHDPAVHILSMSPTARVFSELVPGGEVTWTPFKISKTSHMVDLRYSHVNWNELIHGTSSFAAVEFQGWARVWTYVSISSFYFVHCPGVHTVYLRNNGHTSILTGDVYRSGKVRATVSLTAGPVGIALPLRGAGVAQFSCQLDILSTLIQVQPASHLSHALNLPSSRSRGIVLSPFFDVVIQNTHSGLVEVVFTLETLSLPASSGDTDYEVTVFDNASYTGVQRDNRCILEQGAVVAVPLALYRNYVDMWRGFHIHCSRGVEFNLVVTASISDGNSQRVRVPLDFSCRDYTQSFLLSYIDQDGSVSEAGVILPPGAAVNGGGMYSVILSLHGTGISPLSMADAYKYAPAGSQDYIFGVDGYWVLAPSRTGAHNWEDVGGRSAITALEQIARYFREHSALPQLRLVDGIIAGHSMGGHGAWLLAVNMPDFAACLSVTSGWVRKEEYGASNDFFGLDVSASSVDPSLKGVLEASMSEYHVDRLVSNLRHMAVHIRVGARDMVTHPWFSRRMLRILHEKGVEVTYEEVLDKEHWWWDTRSSNDGGVLNDHIMRDFYSRCRMKGTARGENDAETLHSCDSCGAFSMTRPMQLEVINPSSQLGLCGVRVMQQFISMRLSVVTASCSGTPGKNKSCILYTNGNVRRASLSLDRCTLLHQATSVSVRLSDFQTQDINLFGLRHVELCWTGGRETNYVSVCSGETNPLLEKTISVTGPVRHIHAHSLCVVYATSNDAAHYNGTRTSTDTSRLRELSTFIANSHLAAHHTTVHVYSDNQFLGIINSSSSGSPKCGVMFVGVHGNAAYKALVCSDESSCAVPVRVTTMAGDTRFYVGDLVYAGVGDGVVYSAPIAAANYGEYIAVCLHANSPDGYLHLSRLAWPVVPPMVRSPFANYIPDYIVFSSSIWFRGFGSVTAAGYWNATWGLASEQSFSYLPLL